MREYERTLEWLYALQMAKGVDFELERVECALSYLGDPHRRFPCFHVAGTNGKGSVAAMLHAVLLAEGRRPGLYTSPHLLRLTERIRSGGDEISPGRVVRLTAEIRRRVTERGIELTFFEFVTAMAFLHFAESGVDVGVIEVGLGGRLDATNVVDPAVAVITTIGRDHAEWLGDSIEAVAAEKGGIIKAQRPVVLGNVGADAAAVLKRVAAERGAPLFEPQRDYRAAGESRLDFEGLGWSVAKIPLALRGSYQRENAATALAALAAVRDHLPVSAEAVRRGLASVSWPGRLELVAESPRTILDGAHNPHAVDALVRDLGTLVGDRRLHVLFAAMGYKDWRSMVEKLAPLCHSATVTEVLPPRGAPAHRVAEVFRPHCPVTCDPIPERAWAEVRRRAARSDAIVVTGSLFLVGAVYPLCAPETAVCGAGLPGALYP